MYVQAGLDRCVVEVSGHILGVVVADAESAYFIATSAIAVSADGREFTSLASALRMLHNKFAAQVHQKNGEDPRLAA
ncbi:hypothetical protein [Rhodovibrio salinarum]|uniref:Uncharacterized protein n=1 Tax=Rhodovibrio salinarum TaxID=1087 RepID=A0A934QIQ4_9PROT|nr:hypothetical protein [Rhodovibrio salinarum]MBK1697524.1 hypothetical protein [Rhodovibrio salinarum]